MDGRVRIRDSLAFGWRAFRRNTLFFMVLLLVMGIPLAILNVSLNELPLVSPNPSVLFLRGVTWVLRVLVALVLIVVSLSFCDRGSFEFVQLKGMKPLLIPYLIGSLLLSVLVGVGMALFIVPGVYIAVRYQFMPYLIIDRGMKPLEAFKAAGELVRGSWMNLFLFLLCIVGINFLGTIPLGLGLLITVPVTFMAHARVYRDFVPGP
ncbi:MAG: hypothetical protein WCS47_03195 [Thermovirgaceae bacterium]|jgi:uncharacterized membrane protein|nr:hypothetical protein [Synergistales bacterium]MDI9391703.1 hypothetical protein [Synergistota bacterium]MDY0178277.1 hypothetical protein [Synergistaceae bacterium]HRW86950.1 hypothetical protein [Thermovirgaceae bacterium]MDD3134546.1 hypothetical protein [Synergistales bacterium]